MRIKRILSLLYDALGGARGHAALLIAAVAVLASCGGSGRNDIASDPTAGADTAEWGSKKAEQIKAISMTRPEEALLMLDSAERSRIMPAFDINALRAVVYNNSCNDNVKALHYALLAYGDSALATRPKRRLKVLTVLAYQYFKCGAYDRCLMSADHGITLARELKDVGKEALMLNVKAMCESETGMIDRAMASFDRSIALQRKLVGRSAPWTAWSDLVDVYSQKANVLLDNKRYEAVGAMYSDFLSAIEGMEEAKPEGIRGGNDRARALFYAIYSVAFLHLGDKGRAFDFYNQLTATAVAHTPSGITYLVPYLMAERRYGEAIEKLRDEEANFIRQERDTVNYYFVRTLLPYKAEALYREGHYREAAATGLRIVALNDSLTHRIKSQNAIAMGEMLDSKYKDLRIDEQERDLRTSHTVAVLVTVLLVVSLLLTVRIYTYNRIIRRKNRAAMTTIKELFAYKSQLAFLLSRQDEARPAATLGDTAAAQSATAPSTTDTAPSSVGTPSSPAGTATTPLPYGTPDAPAEPFVDAPKEGGAAMPPRPASYDEENHRLFLQLEQRIINERLFLKPRLSRDELTSLLGISKNRFASLFTQYSGKSFNRYVNDMRLDYAATQLCQNPNYSVEAIALDCGFTVRQTFYRLFTEKFGLTPAEYRRVNEE